MNLQFMKRSLAQCAHSPSVDGGSIAMASPAGFGLDGRAATCTEVRNSNPSGVRESNRVSNWVFRMVAMLAVLLNGSMGLISSAPLSYSGSVPANGSTIESFDDIVLLFDFSGVIEEHGEGDWGVCVNSRYSAMSPDDNKIAALYKGTVEDGELLGYIATTIKATSDLFTPGNELHLSYPDVQVESGQLYTLHVTYDLFAGRAADGKSWTTNTKLSFLSEPLTLTFIGGETTKKVLSVLNWSLEESGSYDYISSVDVQFNYEVELTENAECLLYEDETLIQETKNLSVGESQSSIAVNFDETPLYFGHKYKLLIPSNSVQLKGDSEIFNSATEIEIVGTQYRMFGVGRVRPSNGSESIMDEITIPFKFPEAEDKNYGFVNVDNGRKKWYIHIYQGSNAEGEEIMQVAGEIGTDMKSLIFRPEYAFEPATEYTFVIPEGEILAYEIGAPRETYLKDYISERVELHYTTPSVESLPAWTPTTVNLTNNEEVAELTYFIIDCPDYEYDGADYNTVASKEAGNKGVLYRITENGEEEILTFPVTRKTLDSTSEIGNGELSGRYFVGEINETLYEGNEYKVVWLANSFVVNNAFLGQFIGNPEIAVTLKGATPTSDDFGLTANVTDRLHSHADIFSFVTESEIKPGEDAKMVLKDGAESVAEAPVYVAREATGYRAYADFGGKKLDAGKTYDVVLPEGSVYAANGIVNNPEIKSTLTAMPEAPSAPEFVSIKLNIDEYASATYRMVKGEESVLDLKAGDDWKLDTLTLDGEDVTADVAENGLYTLPALDKDATLDATYAYAHAIDYDYETGVGSIEDLPYSLSKDGSHLIISGLNGGENIAIYTVGGMKIAQLDTVPDDMAKASVLLPEGQVYIVLIDGVSLKVRH